jgi:cytochrome c556
MGGHLSEGDPYVQRADYQAVRGKYAAVAEACNACHRTFATDAPTIKP